MPIIKCYVDDRTLAMLQVASEDTGRAVDELAEAAIADAASRYGNGRSAPPKIEESTND